MATTTYTPIQTYTVSGSATNTITLGSGGTIPQTYTDLILVGNPIVSASLDYKWYVNGDNTSGLYSQTRLLGNGSSATSGRTTGANYLYLDANAPASGSNQVFIMNFQNYANTNVYKTVLVRYSDAGTETAARVNLWRNTNAITSITISTDSSTFAVGSTFTLYGIANAAIGAPKATGGIITYDSTYYYHTFGASGTFTPQQSLTADYLLIGGGAGGSNGGGGAGGFRAFTSQSLTATGYTVTVGAGGNAGANGGASSFNSNSASGGGKGGGATGTAGGSGGGAGNDSPQTGGAGNSGGYTPVEGYAGGNGAANSGGGGGGASQVGYSSSGTTGGNGGNGTNAYSSWAAVTGTGVNGYYAGGGAGAGSSSGGTGGLGGGGRAELNGSSGGASGIVNTGSGGGGGWLISSGAGASGLVIIRYLKA